MKKENGISLVALIITIVVIFVMATISMEAGTDSLEDVRLQGFYTQLDIVQKRVDDIASTNESYVDNNGTRVFLKESGKDLTQEQENFVLSRNKNYNIDNFRYFTKEDLNSILDLDQIDYNLFIDFENRIVIAEEGIKIGDIIYYELEEDETYYVKYEEEIPTVTLSYEIIDYGNNRYKVVVIPKYGDDISRTGQVKYKKATTKYWETSTDSAAIIEELNTLYDIRYTDSYGNSIDEKIKVILDNENALNIEKIEE